MGRLRSGLFVSAFATFTGLIAFVGCSADGAATDDFGPLTEPAPNEPSTPLQPGSSSGTSGSSNGGGDPGTGTPKKDGGGGGKSDASDPDPKPPAPQPGEPCSELNKVFEKECGACGRHSAICLAGEGGTGFWSEYSDCAGELEGGCVPGTTQTEACGNCGTRVLTCSKYCAWNNPVCSGEPPNSCPPGSVELESAGCTEKNTYRTKTCKADCTYNPVSLTCEAPPKVVNVAPTVNSVSSTIVILSSAKTIKAISGSSCTNPTISTTNVAYDYIQVKNPLPKAATVSIWNSGAPPVNAVVDTTLAAYAGEGEPADRKACMQIYTSSTASLTGDTKFAALTDSRKVTVSAGGTVTIYVGGANATAEGAVKLTVRTESIAP